MNSNEVTVVRIYLHEGQGHLDRLIDHLHDLDKVRGLTVFRGIAGFGDSGELHTSRLIDLSLDLPLVVEFFDTPEKIAAILEGLNGAVKPRHVLSWKAQVNE